MKPRTTTATFEDDIVTTMYDPITGRIMGRTHVTRPTDLDIADKIIRAVCAQYNVTTSDLEGPSRTWRLVWPRWVAISLIRRQTKLTTSAIGILFNRDHTTIINALTSFENEMQTRRHADEVAALLK